jgi:hypothetical protein
VPELVTARTGGAVTSIEAVAPVAVAMSAASVSEAVTFNVPDAEDEMTTVAVTAANDVPAEIGAEVEVQVSTVPPLLSEQLHPVALGAAENVSPEGNVAVRIGSWYAGPPDNPSDGTRVRL